MSDQEAGGPTAEAATEATDRPWEPRPLAQMQGPRTESVESVTCRACGVTSELDPPLPRGARVRCPACGDSLYLNPPDDEDRREAAGLTPSGQAVGQILGGCAGGLAGGMIGAVTFGWFGMVIGVVIGGTIAATLGGAMGRQHHADG